MLFFDVFLMFRKVIDGQQVFDKYFLWDNVLELEFLGKEV